MLRFHQDMPGRAVFLNGPRCVVQYTILFSSRRALGAAYCEAPDSGRKSVCERWCVCALRVEEREPSDTSGIGVGGFLCGDE